MVVAHYRDPLRGTKAIELESEHRISKVRRLLPATEEQPEAVLQFFAVNGGLRTVKVSDIVAIK